MNYKDVLINAKSCIGQYCKACVECNGKACKNQIPWNPVQKVLEILQLEIMINGKK